MKISPKTHHALVWAARELTGVVFVFSGFAKLIDPWGGMYKMHEYLAAWDITFVPRSLIFIAAFVLGAFEFICGVTMALGMMRRLVPRLLAALMCVMLPLSLYIAIANPVSDCGCFGEALRVSNTATFIKNIFISALIVYLLRHNVDAPHPVHPLTQLLVVCFSFAYALTISVAGYVVQPLVDFRPYPVGEPLLPDAAASLTLLYSKDGHTQEFPGDVYPGDDWQYVGPAPSTNQDKQLAIFNGDEDVAEELLADSDPMLVLFVADTRRHGMARGAMANKLARIMRSSGGEMIAVVAEPDSAEAHRWARSVSAEYDVYTADDTHVKEVARGDAALVYISGDTVRWKSNLYSFPGDFPAADQDLVQVRPIERSAVLPVATAAYLIVLLLLFCFRNVIRRCSA